MEQGRDAAQLLLDLIAKETANNNLALRRSAVPAATTELKKAKVYFYSSPFARAIETAQACLDELSHRCDNDLAICDKVTIHDGLMERYFGRLDGMALLTYAYVWPTDMYDPTHTAFDVESVAAVATRLREMILDIDSRHIIRGGHGPDNDDDANDDRGGDHIVLTSHADVLQILQVYAAGLDNVGTFSCYRFGNGEIRKMGREVESLPVAVPLEPPRRGE